jgi:hypothetical protein
MDGTYISELITRYFIKFRFSLAVFKGNPLKEGKIPYGTAAVCHEKFRLAIAEVENVLGNKNRKLYSASLRRAIQLC